MDDALRDAIGLPHLESVGETLAGAIEIMRVNACFLFIG